MNWLENQKKHMEVDLAIIESMSCPENELDAGERDHEIIIYLLKAHQIDMLGYFFERLIEQKIMKREGWDV